jgi:Skp family chaperone for outer membrane proteins
METLLRTKGLYKKINDAVAEYARVNGIGLVLIADNAEMEKIQTPEVLQALVSTRKVLYYDGSYDITAAVLTKMNTEFARSH